MKCIWSNENIGWDLVRAQASLFASSAFADFCPAFRYLASRAASMFLG